MSRKESKSEMTKRISEREKSVAETPAKDRSDRQNGKIHKKKHMNRAGE